MPEVIAQNISMSFGEVQALKSITFDVDKHEIFGVIGPDGAGKTTLFRILTSLIIPSSGRAFTHGFDTEKQYKEVRKVIGYMPGRFSLYPDLTVQENLEFFAQIFGTTIAENYDLIEDIYQHIEPFKHRYAGDLSGGMKQKLALSCALIHHPKVLFLDEPSTGIDAVSRQELWQMLLTLKEKGVTIVVSTPYMDEAVLCDRILLLQEGEILGINTPEGIIKNYAKHIAAVTTSDNKNVIKSLRKIPTLASVHSFGYSVHIASIQPIDIQRIIDFLAKEGYKDITVDLIAPEIEDCFMDLMVNH